MLRLSAHEAQSRFADNPNSRWRGQRGSEHTSSYLSRSQRTFVPSISDDWVKGFAMSGAEPVFAIGSCFARGIELALIDHGFEVSSYASEFNDFELSNPNVTGRGFTNKYSSFAITNEIRWALDPSSPFPVDSLVEQADGTTIDPHVNPTLKWLPLKPTEARHGVISDVYRRITDAAVVVITLGLVESWIDTSTGHHLNMTPTPSMISQHPGRYEFVVSDFGQNRAQLDEISSLLRKHAAGPQEIIATVSPVPLNATFSGRDVVAANAYSKALLRTAAEEWCYDETNVHYFPSYEIVTNSAKQLAWCDDGRHVQGQMVQQIMRLFRSTYVPDTTTGQLASARVRKGVRNLRQRLRN